MWGERKNAFSFNQDYGVFLFKQVNVAMNVNRPNHNLPSLDEVFNMQSFFS